MNIIQVWTSRESSQQFFDALAFLRILGTLKELISEIKNEKMDVNNCPKVSVTVDFI